MSQPSESLPQENEGSPLNPLQQFPDFSTDFEGAMRGLGEGVAWLNRIVWARIQNLKQSGNGEKPQ